MSEVEVASKFKAGLGNDVNLYSFGNRKILKGEIVYEHQVIYLKRINCKCKISECNLGDVNLNIFIGNINMPTNAKCFDGWSKNGLLNRIERVVGMKNVLFNIYAEYNDDDF
jgi:hypothetical protein